MTASKHQGQHRLEDQPKQKIWPTKQEVKDTWREIKQNAKKK